MISESLPPERREPLVLKNVNPVRTMNVRLSPNERTKHEPAPAPAHLGAGRCGSQVLVRSRIFICLTIAVLFNSASNKGTTDISPFVLQQSFGMNSQVPPFPAPRRPHPPTIRTPGSYRRPRRTSGTSSSASASW
jgi:hypothetical protein